MTKNHDQHLLSTFARTGSPEAFRELVDRHLDLVYTAARRQVHDPHDAEDITQAVFIVLARKAHSIPHARQLPAWLLKTTHFAAINARKIANRRRQYEQEAFAMLPTTAAPPDPEWDQLSPHLDAALAKLSAADRTVIIAHCIQEQSISELAATLHLPEPTARKRVQRALQRLRTLLQPQTTSTPATLLALPTMLVAHAITPAPASLASAVATTTLATLHGTGASSGALLIAKGVLQMMFLTSAKLTLAIALSTAILVTATATTLHYAQAQTTSPAAPPPLIPSTTTTLPSPSTPKAATIPSPSKTLAQELYELDTLREGENSDFEAVDRLAQDMLVRWKKPEEQGDIYYTWLRVYSQSDVRHHIEDVLRLMPKALELQKAPEKRAILYMDWGSALTLQTPPKERDDPTVRARVVKPFLIGLTELAKQNLPEVAPERPQVTKGGQVFRGMSKTEAEAIRKEHDAQMAAWENAKSHENLISHRHYLVELAVAVYVDWTYTPKGPELEELRKVATENLSQKSEVDRIMTAAAEAVQKRLATEKVWRERSQNENNENQP